MQFVVVRRDLLKDMEWPVGSVIAQACHACTAALWAHRNDACVQEYVSEQAIGAMHKVVKECKGETQLRTLADKLKAEGIAHWLWMEQPENLPTAIALKPYPREQVTSPPAQASVVPRAARRPPCAGGPAAEEVPALQVSRQHCAARHHET